MLLITEIKEIIKIGTYFFGQIGCKCNFKLEVQRQYEN